MTEGTKRLDLGALDALTELAEGVAAEWAPRARGSTTAGQERAVLRLFGVHGLDRAGRPLAGEAVDRYVANHPERLAGGIALPFAMAMLEYDLTPQDLAIDVASGKVDLAMEADLLRESDRRAVAEDEARRLAEGALDRIDANRTARRELIDLLGDPSRPWIGASVGQPIVTTGREEATSLVAAGADVVRVRVPAGRELTERLHDVGVDVEGWGQEFPAPTRGSADDEQAPVGSQRGLALLRSAVDEAAAERRRYVRLATVTSALAAPEQAVVAGFERVDIVEADLVAEIVDGNVDPDRAIGDHSFAHRLHRRGGSLVLVGSGPLVVGPDMARGVPSNPSTRAGRALALQLLGVELARRDGLSEGQILVGGMPAWLADERHPAAQALAEVALRRALFPSHPLAFEEPPGTHRAAVLWPFLLSAALSSIDGTVLVMRRTDVSSAAETYLSTRAAAQVAAEVTGSLSGASLRGLGLDHARGAVAAAIETLERLAADGWEAVLGVPMGGRDRTRLGADAVVERTEAFDPFAGM